MGCSCCYLLQNSAELCMANGSSTADVVFYPHEDVLDSSFLGMGLNVPFPACCWLCVAEGSGVREAEAQLAALTHVLNFQSSCGFFLLSWCELLNEH